MSNIDDIVTRPPRRPWWRSPALWMVLVGLSIRVGMTLLYHTSLLSDLFQSDRHYHGVYGFETGSIARSIALGKGFSSPFPNPSGPTTWIAPIYPYMCAGVFKLLGVYSHRAGITILLLNSLFSALTAVVIYRICDRISGSRLAFWSGWAWSLVPIFSFWAVIMMWETSLSALLVTLGILFAMDLQQGASWKKWFGFGAFWGLALLTNPALLTIMGLSFVWLFYQLRRRGIADLKPLAASVLTCVAVVSPWLIRNRIDFGEFVFIRGNFGFELYLGNHVPLQHYDPVSMHPAGNKAEFQRYKSLGEVAFVAAKKQEALDFIRQHPKDFLVLTATRLLWFWDGTSSAYLVRLNSPPRDLFIFMYFSLISLAGLGTALARRLPLARLFAAIVLLYPWPYYLTYVQNRYRHAIEPLMLIMSLYFVEQVILAIRTKVAARSMARRLKLGPGFQCVMD